MPMMKGAGLVPAVLMLSLLIKPGAHLCYCQAYLPVLPLLALRGQCLPSLHSTLITFLLGQHWGYAVHAGPALHHATMWCPQTLLLQQIGNPGCQIM